jgi:hypothetical protein
VLIFALALQVAAPPVPPPPMPGAGETPEYWRSLQPIMFSTRARVVCRDTGTISAEFAYRDGRVSTVAITGLAHRLSKSERIDLDAALRGIGLLDRVSIGCGGPNVLITVTARPFLDRGRPVAHSLSIVWSHATMMGTGSRRLPVQELGPDLYAAH